MHETEGFGFCFREPAPIGKRGVQHGEGADEICLDESRRTVDRSVDMTFRREMHDDIRLELGESGGDRLAVADIRAPKGITRILRDRRKRIEITCVGKLIIDEDSVVGLAI